MAPSVRFEPKRDIPALDGKVILVTGGNVGLGKQAILEFSRHHPAQIWLGARNMDKAKAAADDIRRQVPDAPPINLLQLDLTSFESIKKAAKTFMAESERLDILMLNAGIMAAPPGLTKEGYELQMGTNHMGHALLTKLLLPVLDKTAKGDAHSDVRIVSLSSAGHKLTAKGGIQLDTLKTPADRLGAYERYGQSKLANILWIRQMAKHYPQFKAVAVHPGVVSTNLLAGTNGSALSLMLKAASALHFFSTVEDGVKNQLWAAVANNVQSGEYYEPIGKAGSASAFGKDDKLATKLWDWTEEELAKYTS